MATSSLQLQPVRENRAFLERLLFWLRRRKPSRSRDPSASDRLRRTVLHWKKIAGHKDELLRASAEFNRIINNNDQFERTIDLVLRFVQAQVGASEITLFLVNERTGLFEPKAQLQNESVRFAGDVDVVGISQLDSADFAECSVQLREIQAVEYTIYLAADKRNIGAMKVLVPLMDEQDRDLVGDILEHMKSLFAISLTKVILHERSITDELTTLYNKSHFLVHLEREFKKAVVGETGVAVLMLDIDHFKKVNDTFGHLSGDIILREVAAVLKKCAKDSSGVAFRYGGEEMNLVLSRPGLTLRDALDVAEHVRTRIERRHFQSDKGEHVPITLSVGVAKWDDSCRSAEELYVRADQALYVSKSAGRNRVTPYEDGPDPRPYARHRAASMARKAKKKAGKPKAAKEPEKKQSRREPA